MNRPRLVPILVADDDEEDRQLIRDALKESHLLNEIRFVKDGEELMQALLGSNSLPGLILLDLNMPKKDGREVLKELKQHEQFKKIPVIIFSTTNNEQEMRRCYELGANSYITKPNSFDSLIKTVAVMRNYWMNTTGRS